jgi:hypothetical protein
VKQDVHRRLRDLSERRGKEYGKLVQKLLAIAFAEAGARTITERGTQGIDLEIDLGDGRMLAVEVKTAQTGVVSFGKKDIEGLASQRGKGREPYFACLGSALLDEWIFARCFAGEIREKRDYPLTQLRAYRDRALESIVRETFSAAVVAHAAAAGEGGQGALDAVLKGYPCYEVA